jgi:hypothetical protein
MSLYTAQELRELPPNGGQHSINKIWRGFFTMPVDCKNVIDPHYYAPAGI